MDLWNSIRAKWEQEGLLVPIGVTPEDLTEFERKYRVILPESMLEFYLSANGNSDMDRNFYKLCPLQDVKLVSEELTDPTDTDRNDYPQCFIFADYLLWCWAYAIFLGDDPAAARPVYIVRGEKKRVVADSFLEFMQKCAIDSKDLY